MPRGNQRVGRPERCVRCVAERSGVFFTPYLCYRRFDKAVLERSQALADARLGLLNTRLLLTRPRFVILALKSLCEAPRRRTRDLLAAAPAGGLGFDCSAASGAGSTAGVCILFVALAKVAFILFQFMELRRAPRVWQAVFASWLGCPGVAMTLLLLAR